MEEQKNRSGMSAGCAPIPGVHNGGGDSANAWTAHIRKILGLDLSTLSGFCLVGMSHLLIMTLGYVQTELRIEDWCIGLFPFLVFVWYILPALPFFRKLGGLGEKRVALIAVGLMVSGLLLPVLVHGMSVYMTAFALIGLGCVLLHVALWTYMVDPVHGRAKAVSHAFGWMAGSVAAFCGTFVAAFFYAAWGRWQLAFLVFAVVALCFGVNVYTACKGGHDTKFSLMDRSFISDTRGVGMGFCFPLLFLLNGVDVSVNMLVPRLLMERCATPMQDAVLGSGFYFVCKALGFLISTVWGRKMGGRGLTVCHVLVVIAALCAMMFVRDEYLVLALTGMIGLGISTLLSGIYCRTSWESFNVVHGVPVLLLVALCGGALIPLLSALAMYVFGLQAGALPVLVVCNVCVMFWVVKKSNLLK